MIIWIDGALGIGKTTVAQKVKEGLLDNEIEFLDSDFYFLKMLEEMKNSAKKENRFPAIRGKYPQINEDFIVYFRNLIKENKSEKLIISMALTQEKCKEGIFDYLIRTKENLLHIILTAEEETIKSRIEHNALRKDKNLALETLSENITFLNENFKDAIWIDTDGKSACETADEIIKYITSLENINNI